MTQQLLSLRQKPLGAIALALLLAATVVGCAPTAGGLDEPVPGSGSSVPPQIDYHGWPYNIQAG